MALDLKDVKTMTPFFDPTSAGEPRAQGDGSPEPVYTADLPELSIQMRGNVDWPPAFTFFDESDTLEAGYGHGV